MLMMLEDDKEREDLLLTDADFPTGFVNFSHPDDYIEGEKVEERILHHSLDHHHHRLLWRVSWKLGDKFFPFTFILDTGAPKYLYLGKLAWNLLKSKNELKIDQDLGESYTTIWGRKCIVVETPDPHAPCNIIGLQLLLRWQLVLHDAAPHFSWNPDRHVITAD